MITVSEIIKFCKLITWAMYQLEFSDLDTDPNCLYLFGNIRSISVVVEHICLDFEPDLQR